MKLWRAAVPSPSLTPAPVKLSLFFFFRQDTDAEEFQESPAALNECVLMNWKFSWNVTSHNPQLSYLQRLIGPASEIVFFSSSSSAMKGEQLNPIGACSNAGTLAPGGPGSPDV